MALPIPSWTRPVQILLVEDNPGDAVLITTLLREHATPQSPVEIRVASDGEMATDLLFQRGIHANALPPDVVVLDLNLPKKNGLEVMGEMRNWPATKNIPVFVMTTSRSHDDILKSYALGAISFITKPSQFSEFQNVIQRFFSVELPRVMGALPRVCSQ